MNKRIQPILLLSSLVLLCPLARGQAAKDFDETPMPVKSVAPIYPAEMKRDKVSGIVTLKIVIDENGNVADRTVSKSTRPEFESAALEAIQQWKFKPARKGGAAVRATVTIPMKFTAES
jgi:protein TonB